MADPMWSGGPPQFQDVNPWIWAVWDAWKQEPFYPTNPPRDPGAFADSVMPICDFPILGTAYAWFIVRYVEDYTAAWYDNPPSTSTTTPNPPEVPQDNSLSLMLAAILDRVELIDANIGTYAESQTVMGDLAAIYARVTGGQEAPPPMATKADTALVMSGLYYIARYVADPTPSPNFQGILDAIAATEATILEDSAGQSTAIESNQAANVISLEQLIQYGLALSGDTAAIIELINAIEPPVVDNQGFYPGLGAVTVGGTVTVTGPTTITGPMDGLLISVSAVPPGQSVTVTPAGKRFKGLGWVVFMTAQGEGEQLLKIETEKLVLLPKSIGTPASAEVYCKAGASMSVKPFTINA